MKVGIYNRWLATLGGGEKHSLAIAEYLSHNHEVHVISHQSVSREEAAQRLNLDLSQVQFDVIPACSSEELQQMTADYDLFLNTSFMEFLSSKAKHSAALIFFPAPIGEGSTPRLRYRLGWAAKRWFMIPTFSDGVVNIRPQKNQRQEIEVSSLVRIKLPESYQSYQLSFELAILKKSIQEVTLTLDRKQVEKVSFDDPERFKSIVVTIPQTRGRQQELVIEAPNSEMDGTASLVMTGITVHTPRYKMFQSIFQGVLSKYGLRFQLLLLPYSAILEAMDTYDALWANSEYTRRWIRNYWNRESRVLYPPVDIEAIKPAPKKNQILNVGRFFAGDHNKKHKVMVRAFKEIVDEGLKDWELHLVGGTDPREINQKYLAEVIAETQGYPIYVHPDLPYPDLLKLYSESAIYWHASGYGEDENREPVKFEHFGITTVEGMAAGCVPVVIGKGGQTEIVRHGQNGYLWYSLDELKQYTRNLIAKPELRKSLSTAAIVDSQRYSTQNFQNILRERLKEIGTDQ